METKPVVKHTPTPWHRNVSPAYKYPIYADRDGDPKGKNWIHIAGVLGRNPNAEADLDFIIRAVNNHEKLISALEAFTALDEEECFYCGSNVPLGCEKACIVKKARQVIAEAEAI